MDPIDLLTKSTVRSECRLNVMPLDVHHNEVTRFVGGMPFLRTYLVTLVDGPAAEVKAVFQVFYLIGPPADCHSTQVKTIVALIAQNEMCSRMITFQSIPIRCYFLLYTFIERFSELKEESH